MGGGERSARRRPTDPRPWLYAYRRQMLVGRQSFRVSWCRAAPRASKGVVPLIRPEGTPVMLKSLKSTSTSLILLGILAVIVGIIAIAWPGVTILALVILFAIYALWTLGCRPPGP